METNGIKILDDILIIIIVKVLLGALLRDSVGRLMPGSYI